MPGHGGTIPVNYIGPTGPRETFASVLLTKPQVNEVTRYCSAVYTHQKCIATNTCLQKERKTHQKDDHNLLACSTDRPELLNPLQLQ